MTVKKDSNATVEESCQDLCELSLPELEADIQCDIMGNYFGSSTSAGEAKAVSFDLEVTEEDTASGTITAADATADLTCRPPKPLVTRQPISIADLSDLCSDEESDEDNSVDESSGSAILYCGVDSVPAQKTEDKPKYTVVFDLDETLVYARDGTIRPRPHIDRLFEILKNRCEVIVWTAGVEKYAQQVLERIDKVGALSFCVCRHEAWFQQPCNVGRNYVKDLTVLGRDVSRTIIIENTPDCVVRNPQNSIIVADYIREAPGDVTLAIISNVLDGLIRSNMSVPQYLSTDLNLKLETLRNAMGDTLSVYMLA